MKLTEKELSSLNDALNDEELLVKKFQMLAGHTQDEKIKSALEEISQKHQSHFNALYEYLK